MAKFSIFLSILWTFFKFKFSTKLNHKKFLKFFNKKSQISSAQLEFDLVAD